MKTLLLLVCLSISNYAFSQALDAGLWKAKSNFSINGLPLPASENEECITKAEAKDIKATITKDLRKNNCVLDAWKASGGKLEASLTCKTDELEASGKIRGTYTAKSYDLTGEANGTYQKSIPASAVIKLKGQWTKTCGS